MTWTSRQVLARFRGFTAAHFTDSKGLASIICKGSSNPKLQPLIMQAVLALREFSIKVVPFWKSREEELIKWADFGSWDFHSDDISVDWDTFRWAEQVSGKSFSVDGFASGSNSKCARFFSKRFISGTSGVDFLM